MKLLLENWRKYLAEAWRGSGATMPLREIFDIFMTTIDSNIKELQKVADDPQALAKKLTDIFEPEELNVTWKPSKSRFDDLGDGAILHGEVIPEEGVNYSDEGAPLAAVGIVTNKWTGESIENWDTEFHVPGGGFTSERTVTGKQLMAYSVRGTIIHEFVHQAQHKAGVELGAEPTDFEKLASLSGVDPEEMNELMTPILEVLTSKDYLENGNLDKMPNETVKENIEEVRKLVNKVYFGNGQEFPGWAQGVPSDLVDLAHRNQIKGLEGVTGEELKAAIIKIIDTMIANADKGYDGLADYQKAAPGMRYYSHLDRGFGADYGVEGWKKFLEIAKGYAEKYSASMY